jgi:alpha-beta hydrolase superfamily lysophospholipase
LRYREFEWQSAIGKPVFACEWRPEDEAAVKASVILVHGMGEHSGRYRHVAENLITDGYAVFAFDQYGHGRTEGKRGHTRSYEDLLEGIDRLLAEAGRRFPGKPKFLFGHSMGGNLTLNYLLRRRPDIAGAVVTGPWLRLAFDPPVIPLAFARVLERIYPGLSNNRPLQANHLTSDPDMVRQLAEDTLGHGRITARFFLGVHRAGRWALDHASELTVPVLLMHGGDDKVTSLEASRRFAEKAGSRITFREWPGFRHELHNEVGREEVFSVIRAWLAQQISS